MVVDVSAPVVIDGLEVSRKPSTAGVYGLAIVSAGAVHNCAVVRDADIVDEPEVSGGDLGFQP